MSSEVTYLSEVIHAADLKKKEMTSYTLNYKAVEITEVIDKVNSKKSGRKNHRFRRIKKKPRCPQY